jgi:hypothetical protein
MFTCFKKKKNQILSYWIRGLLGVPKFFPKSYLGKEWETKEREWEFFKEKKKSLSHHLENILGRIPWDV